MLQGNIRKEEAFSNLLYNKIVLGKKNQVDGCTDKQEQLHEIGEGEGVRV